MNALIKIAPSLLLLIAAQLAHADNPCAPKLKNPCSPGAASDRIDPKLVSRPVGSQLASGHAADLVKEGEQLWKNKSLSSNGMACVTCHQANAAFNASFAKPYPHNVAMVQQRSGLKKIALDEMVQFCMLAPMAAKPLAWDSRELAALTAYSAQMQKSFKPAAGAAKNPCAPAKNPCVPNNPCAPRK